jgi:hypothetical protein
MRACDGEPTSVAQTASPWVGGVAGVAHVRADALVAQAVRDVVGQFGLILDHEHPHGAIVPQPGSHGYHKRVRAGADRGPAAAIPTWRYPERRAPGLLPGVIPV